MSQRPSRNPARVVCELALFAALPAFSQTTLGTATIAGSVLDSRGDPIPVARVLLTDTSRGLRREAWSDANGAYQFVALNAGSYDLEVSKSGFDTSRTLGVSLALGQRRTADVTLQIGDTRTTVQVFSDGLSHIDNSSSVVGPVIESQQILQLPLNGRNFLQLAQLAATAVETTSANNLFTGNIGHPGRSIVLPGTLPHSVGYILNGMDIRGSRDGELALNLSVAAIEQFRIQQSFFLPDQGIHAAVVNVATRSGSNRFHGELFEFFRSGRLDARSFFSAAPEDLKRNQFGFSLGGPILKDRAWFHGFYEGLREITAYSRGGYSPTAPMFQGDFSSTGRAIFDPATFSPQTGRRQPFPGNLVPAPRINPVSLNLSRYYLPGSSLAASPINISGTPRNTLDDNQGGLRIDSSLSPNQQLFVQLFRQNSPVETRGLFPLTGATYPNEAGLLMAQHTWSLSSRTINTFRGGFVRTIAIGGNEARDQGRILDAIGIPNTPDGRGISTVNLAGYSSFGRAAGDLGNADNTWQFDEELNFTRSRHDLKAGLGLRYRRGWHQNSNAIANGALSFDSASTSQLSANQPVPSTGDSFADFLLGIPLNGQMGGLGVVEYRSTRISLFLQDTWRATRNLTVSAGVSWTLATPPDPRGPLRDTAHRFDLGTGELGFASLGQIDPRVAKTDWNNFAPRLGFAWRPAFLRRTVIHAGAGVCFSEVPWVGYQYAIAGPPYASTQVFSNVQSLASPTYELGRNIFSPPPANQPPADPTGTIPPGSSILALDPNLATPYVSQWNLSIQHAINPANSFELAYLGLSGHRQTNLADVGQCRPARDLRCDPATRPWNSRYGAVFWADTSGNSAYDSLLARYDHRSPAGPILSFEYAFAKNLTDAYQTALEPYSQIGSCRRCDRGPASFDVRHRAAASVVWELPFGRGRRLLQALTGGWTLSAIVTAASGPPVYLRSPNRTGSPVVLHLPNRSCDGRDRSLSSNVRGNGFLWFDTACFPLAPVGSFGNSGRTVIPGPGLANLDIGAAKTLPVSESFRLQFRTELFNAFNHAQFQLPNGDAGAGHLFGRISSTRPPRLIQLALKLLW